MNSSLKAIAAVSAGIVSLLFTTPSEAVTNSYKNGNWYAGLSGDVTWMRHSDTGGGGNIQLGYRFIPSDFGDFRLEAEGGYHGAGGNNGNSSTHYFTYMGNLYFDANNFLASTGMHLVPYVGAGLGGAAVHQGNGGISTTFHHHENDFAWQLMAGLQLASTNNMDWLLGYRFQNTSDSEIRANSVELGVRFHF